VLALGTETSACLPAGLRHVLFVDATWETNVDYYPTTSGVCRRSRRLSEAMEQDALDRVDHVVITSEWARRSLIEHYGMQSSQVTVVPIGANTVCATDPLELPEIAAARSDGPLRLLWIGSEWDRKGGALAVAATAVLHGRGLPVELHVVGARPHLDPEPWLHVHGFLSFTDDGDRLQSIFRSAFALVLPTLAEDAGIVFAEAASFAVPSIAPATGGVPTMVADGVSGVLLRDRAPATEFADAIEALWHDPERYRALSASARARFEREMTWAHVAEVLVERLTALTT
jgi:glycosyltransferase involved in cell wall biosynthesis